jgi:hypothetical protein
VQSWKKETLWKNNINFVEDALMTFERFILIAIIVLREKEEESLPYRQSYLRKIQKSLEMCKV